MTTTPVRGKRFVRTLVALTTAVALWACDEDSSSTSSESDSRATKPKAKRSKKSPANTATASASQPVATSQPAIPAKWKPVWGPLLSLDESMEKGLTELFRGAEPAKAFAPYALNESDSQDELLKRIREAVADKKITAAKLKGFEFELELGKQGRKVMHLYTVVVTDLQTGPVFGAIWEEQPFVEKPGDQPTWDWDSRGVKIELLKEPAAALAGAARSLVQLMRSADCRKLPLLTTSMIPSTLEQRERRELEGMAERSAQKLPAACDRLAGISVDEIRLKMDDVAFNCFDKSGTQVESKRLDVDLRDGMLYVHLPYM